MIYFLAFGLSWAGGNFKGQEGPPMQVVGNKVCADFLQVSWDLFKQVRFWVLDCDKENRQRVMEF